MACLLKKRLTMQDAKYVKRVKCLAEFTIRIQN